MLPSLQINRVSILIPITFQLDISKMQFLTLIPAETKLSILLCVILPTIAVLFLRGILHKRLEEMNSRIARLSFGKEEGIQPPIVKKLKNRYEKASQKLEHVNTVALIDSIYKDETISYLGLKIEFDRAEAITKILPNLLIAFGLIGTFWGITSNLSNISETMTTFNESDGNLSGLVSGLKKPLQDMGIAFSTSLFGIFFGSILTVANTIWNTSLAKYNLLAGLEDYLDNIYKPTVEGNTRLDRAIEKMVEQQQEFLLRFHENVGRVLESSFGKAAIQIADECSKINKIAEGVYTNFANAAGTIATGATTFEYAANSLKSQNQTLSDSLREFKGGVEIFKIAANQIEQNNIVQNIESILVKLNTSQQAFTNSTQTLESSLAGITSSNQIAAQLAQSVYKTLQTSASQMSGAAETIGAGAIIFQQSTATIESQTQTLVELMPQLRSGVKNFVTAANKVKTNNIIENLDTVIASLSTTQQAFTVSTQTLATGVENIVSNNQQATQLAQQVYHGLEMSGTRMQQGANSFVDAAQIIHDSSLAVDLTAAAKSWQTAQIEFTNSTAVFSKASEKLYPVATQLEPAIVAIDRSVNNLQQFGKQVVTLSQNTLQVSESTQATVADIDRNYQQVLNSTELSVQNLGKINHSSWQELRDILNHRTESDLHQHERSIEALNENMNQGSLANRELLGRLLVTLEKLEARFTVVDKTDAYDEGLRSRVSRIFNNRNN